VPVFLSNEDYHGKTATAPPEEVKALERIYHEALHEKRHAGSVCVYLVAPDGDGVASLIVSDACKPGQMLKLLEATADKLGATAGKPLAPLAKQSAPPKRSRDSLLLHLVSRYDRRGSWAEFPAENWVVLERDEWARFLPPPGAKAGSSWTIDSTASAKLLTLFFPQTEICTFGKLTDADGPYQHRLEEHELAARVVGSEGEVIRIRLDGKLRLRHKFYPNHEDENRAVAKVLGYLEWDSASKRVKSFRLVTTEAIYAKWPFTVAVREREQEQK
jgi:hypothetical protein